MEYREFHNALRVLLNIDADEFLQATRGIDVKPPDESVEWQDWLNFRADAHMWFIRAPADLSEKLWSYIEGRINR